MVSMRTNLTFPTTSRELSLITSGFFTARVTTMKNCLMRLWTHPCLNPFFTGKKKVLSSPDGFKLYGKLGIDFFSAFELLYREMKARLCLIRARPNLYMISDNPDVNLGIVEYSLYPCLFYLKDEYHKKRMDMLAYTPVEYNYL